MDKKKHSTGEPEQPFVTHLIELRDRLLKVVLVVVLIFLGMFPFANDLYRFLAEPLIQQLPQNSTMIATGVISPFLTPFKLALVVSVFAAIPFILYQAWAFVAPGLYKTEQRLVYPLLISSTILFYLGMAFAYYVVFPLVFSFMATTTPEGVSQAPDITMYLDFVLKMFFAFGVAFEVPIATILLVWTGAATPQGLAAKRPYIIVGAFVVAMLLTPPDVISQSLLAFPMWVLFEIGLVMSRLYVRKKRGDSSEDETPPPSTSRTAPAPTSADDTQLIFEDEDYVAMSEAEMDAELDNIEADEADDDSK